MYLENFIQSKLIQYILRISNNQDIRENIYCKPIKFLKRNESYKMRYQRYDIEEVKQKRAQGGCLGTKSRRKT